MQTTYKQQIEAIQQALVILRLYPDKDDLCKALNDAGSTIASITLSPNPESVALKAKSDSLI